jgi:hypothetical protein
MMRATPTVVSEIDSAEPRGKMQREFRHKMTAQRPSPPLWINVRLGDDMNWWLEATSNDFAWPEGGLGVLDPRQVAHLIERLTDYRSHGLTPRRFTDAFHVYSLASEMEDGLLKLTVSEEGLGAAGGELFALPILEQDGEGPYYEFLDALGAARIRKLNATHHYARNRTEADMFEELDTLDLDRYFGSTTMHVFDEINEILEWEPAE